MKNNRKLVGFVRKEEGGHERFGSTSPPQPSRSRPRGKRAKVIDEEPLRRVFDYIDQNSSTPAIDRLKVQLSFKAGLRVSEIAQLTLADVTDVEGRIARYVRVPSGISKNGKGREIPMHPDVRQAIQAFRASYPDLDRFGVTQVGKVIRDQSVNSLTVWFYRLYQLVGLTGCSSHSGRRTFLTRLARCANEFGNSLRDVQVLAGHARLDTTERYIEPSSNMHDLVNSLASFEDGEGERKRKAQRERERKARSDDRDGGRQ